MSVISRVYNFHLVGQGPSLGSFRKPMSFVFRGTRGDIETGFPGLIPERRAVVSHAYFFIYSFLEMFNGYEHLQFSNICTLFIV